MGSFMMIRMHRGFDLKGY